MVLDALFGPLAALPPALAVLIFSAIVLVLINVFYKVLINQKAAKAIRDRQKELSKKMQEERKAGNTDKMNALMRESLQENSRIMRMTLKPMIVSFVIVIILLPWLHATYGDKTAVITDGKANESFGKGDPFWEALSAARTISSDKRVKSIVVDAEEDGDFRYGFSARLAEVLKGECVRIRDLRADLLLDIARSGGGR